MYESRFTKWVNWNDRESLEGVEYPGIYVVAISNTSMVGEVFSWSEKISYIGMTNAISGLKGRLKQFDNTISGKYGHGGADRVRYKHQEYAPLVSSLYVAVAAFKCRVKSNQPEDLRAMGEVAKFEFDCFACFVEQYGELSEFNNKKKSPKYSLTIGRNSDG